MLMSADAEIQKTGVYDKTITDTLRLHVLKSISLNIIFPIIKGKFDAEKRLLLTQF